LVHDQQHRPVALLTIDSDVWLAHPGGDMPVHIADVIAGEITTNLLEVQSSAAQP
jgi:hypothetical protein